MKKQFIMMSGIPRSGSTVLCSLLNQHPEIFASTTSPLIEFIEQMNNHWGSLSSRQLSPYPYHKMISGLLDGAYQDHTQNIIVDKNRLWPRYTKLMNAVLDEKPKIICTVRDIPEVLASYITLINKSDSITYIDQDIIDLGLPVNTKNRCKIIWEKYVLPPYTSLRIGYNSTTVDLCIVSYDDIVNNSQETMNKICNFIGVQSFDLSLDNLKPMKENDAYHGGLPGLHDIRPVVKRISDHPSKIIGNDMVKLYSSMKLEFWKK